MKLLLILLLFFSCLNVSAKTIITPYLKVGEVPSNYQVNDNEKIEVVTYYKQEKINKDFKYLEKANKEYTIKSEEIKYGEYDNFQKKRLDNNILDEDIKTIYYYQDLKKIDSLTIKDINNLLITKLTLKYKDNTIYQLNDIKNGYKIKLSKKYSPIYLTLEITCFLNQGDLEGSFFIESDNYVNRKIKVTDKGFNNLNIKLINCLERTIYDKKIKKTTNIDDKFYINIISEETMYRYRKKYYKYYKDESKIDSKILPDYKVVSTFNKYYLYRKEIIEVYDNIILNNYLDLDKVVKTSTIPLNKLKFNYSNNCGSTVLSIKYQDFKVNADITFNCEKYSKSRVKVGKTKSLKREIFGILFKTLFLRKL